MEKEIFIRLANERDVSEIKRITLEAFELYAKSAGFSAASAALNETEEDILNDIKNNIVFVAIAGGKTAGSLRIRRDGNDTAYLSRFGVSSESRRSGCGQALMKAVDRHMLEIGVKKLYLHTASKVSALMRFYYGCGFYVESVSTDKGYIRALMCKEY